MLDKIIDLKSGEEIQGLIRSSFWHWFWPILLAIILILLPFFLIYPLFKSGWWGIAGFAIILGAGLLVTLRIFLTQYFTVFILTNQKIVDMEQTGFFTHRVTGFLYERLRDVSYESGPLQAMVKVGDIYLNFYGGQNVKLKLASVKNPQAAVNQIIEQQENFLKTNPSGAAAEKLLARIKQKLGPEKFNELISD